MTDKFNTSHQSLIEREVTEGLSTYRTQTTLVTQIVTVLLVGNVYVIGYVINSGNFSFFYFSAVFPLLILFVRYVSFKLMLPIIYCIYKFEKELEQPNIDFLAMTYMRSTDIKYSRNFDTIISMSDRNERMKRLGKMATSLMGLISGRSKYVTVLCLVSSLSQIIVSIIMTH